MLFRNISLFNELKFVRKRVCTICTFRLSARQYLRTGVKSLLRYFLKEQTLSSGLTTTGSSFLSLITDGRKEL